jgi:predicted ATPase
LEEPETHLHPSGIRALADAVVSRVVAGDQIVLSTHSLELVERLRGRLGEGGPPVDHMSVVRLYREGSALRTREIKGDRIAFVLDEMGEDLR